MKIRYIPFIVLLIAAAVAASIFLIWSAYSNNTGGYNSNNLNQETSDQNGVVYSTRRVTGISESGVAQYQTSVFISNIEVNQVKKIYEISADAVVQKFADGSIGIINEDTDGQSSVIRINKAGKILNAYTFEESVNNVIVSPNGEFIAYTSKSFSASTESEPSRVIQVLVIQDEQGNMRQYFTKDIFPNISSTSFQVQALNFSANSQTLYIVAWPLPRGGDVVDPHAYYSINLTNDKIEEITFSGSRNLDYTFDPQNPSIGSFDILPNSSQAIATVFTEVDTQKNELWLYDLVTKERTKLLTLSDIEQGNTGNTYRIVSNGISPNENIILLEKTDGSVYEFDIPQKTIVGEVPNLRAPVGWLNDDEIVFQDYRKNSWDDQQHSLKVYNRSTRMTSTIYTQTTDHVEGGGLYQVGDEYFHYVGSL